MEATMRRLISIAVFLTVFAFVPLTAQNDSGHVFVTLYYKALPGQGGLYNRYVWEYGFPFYDELVRRGDVVSFKIVYGWSGTNEWTHMLISEYENWDAVDTPVDAPEVCRAVLGMTCVEKQQEIGIENLADVRVFVRREIWGSLRP
jgi:hypothetical protein